MPAECLASNLNSISLELVTIPVSFARIVMKTSQVLSASALRVAAVECNCYGTDMAVYGCATITEQSELNSPEIILG